jgi:hypothetical protein
LSSSIHKGPGEGVVAAKSLLLLLLLLPLIPSALSGVRICNYTYTREIRYKYKARYGRISE